MTGKVYLVGAGPGDSQLLTLKGKDLLSQASVVVYDRLVSQEIMNFVSDKAKLINVGKNVGHHPVPQHEINRILLEEAQKGETVVRLKGGDPFVFGRGGEELELLAEHKVPFEVVPGITSSIAAPAYGGIPVTHRNFCSSLHIITGHGKGDSQVNIDFESLVRLNGTLIFMMSVSTVGRIAKGLMDAGMDTTMPAAVVENGTRPEQRKFVADLGTIEEVVKANKVVSPAVIIVGQVCSLSDDFDWFSKLPLKGRRYIVTQPQRRTSRLDDGLRALGADTLLYPCIKTVTLDGIAPDFENYDTLGFTSVQGVMSFFEYLDSIGKDSRALAGKRFVCIGKTTARELKNHGIVADFVPSVYDGEHLAEEMIKTGFIDKSNKVMMLRAELGAKALTDVFDREGITYCDYYVYKTEYISHPSIENNDDYDFVTFTSKSCVDGFVKTQKKENFDGMMALCIGRQTADEAEKYGFNCIVSDVATVDSMIEKAVEING